MGKFNQLAVNAAFFSGPLPCDTKLPEVFALLETVEYCKDKRVSTLYCEIAAMFLEADLDSVSKLVHGVIGAYHPENVDLWLTTLRRFFYERTAEDSRDSGTKERINPEFALGVVLGLFQAANENSLTGSMRVARFLNVVKAVCLCPRLPFISEMSMADKALIDNFNNRLSVAAKNWVNPTGVKPDFMRNMYEERLASLLSFCRSLEKHIRSSTSQPWTEINTRDYLSSVGILIVKQLHYAAFGALNSIGRNGALASIPIPTP